MNWQYACRRRRRQELLDAELPATTGWQVRHTYTGTREFLYEAHRMSVLTTLNSTVEKLVQLAPAQYQWEYKRFRERPKGAEKIYRFNKPAGYHD